MFAKPDRYRALSIAAAVLLLSAAAEPGQQPPQKPPLAPVPDILRQYKTVTAERLKRPEDNDWLMIRRTYDGWGYSPISQITTGNVGRLQPAWVFSTG